MAIFITTTKSNATNGEKKFAKLLKEHLDDNYLVWHDAPTCGKIQRFPDFLIFHPNHGLWAIEIKDWSLRNLKKFNNEVIFLQHKETEKRHTHPAIQARECLLPVINNINKDPSLLQKEGKYKGNLVFPWGYGAVMTNWEYNKIPSKYVENINQCFPQNKVLFKEDIEHCSKQEFIEKLHNILPYNFSKGLTARQIDKVRAYIFPEFIIKQGELFDDETDILPDSVAVMDAQQEQVARRMKDGHRVIHGVAGSGKTVLLEYRAKKLAEETNDKEVLVVCFNILLATVIGKRLKNTNIKVVHFHGWCMQMRDEYNLSVSKAGNYVANLEQSVIGAVDDGTIPANKYHAILIDEGHDFAAEWLRILSKLPDEKYQHLLLLYDDAQSIYANQKGIDFTLSSVGIQARGRTTIISKNYRNSLEIFNIAEKFIKQFVATSTVDDDHIPLIDMQAGGNKGHSEPTLSIFDGNESELTGIIQKIREWQQDGISLSDIAILFYSNTFATQLHNKLTTENFNVSYVANKNDKMNYDPFLDAITLCSVQSSKGAEFSHVILSQIGTYGKRKNTKPEQEARLIYVGISRARNALHITSAQNNDFTDALSKALNHEAHVFSLDD